MGFCESLSHGGRSKSCYLTQFVLLKPFKAQGHRAGRGAGSRRGVPLMLCRGRHCHHVTLGCFAGCRLSQLQQSAATLAALISTRLLFTQGPAPDFHSTRLSCLCGFCCSTAPVTIMGYTTQARRSPAWSVLLSSGLSKTSANG